MADGAQQETPSRNTAAKWSLYAGGGAMCCLVLPFLVPPFVVAYMCMAFLLGVAAIVTGHFGRSRGRRLGGDGRGRALVGILLGWFAVFVCVVVVAVVVGITSVLAVIIDSF
ncbi:hypothetical protein Acsp04_67000 [Actinomadura sp. NBRC 104425]|uniref:DUF4190 domain-containing protein n=1 Tax=Actinomadura sp. NBRC 104425 TaxID=3032204 RepID=UPI0024A599FB|nr:DUF4190 domain-containing protein [Actinomadura sp. NBRC 104425]GLZ16465.1 hypothetical protein Acsp04_67000 [Actinomadura sp. NBRC 104425]